MAYWIVYFMVYAYYHPLPGSFVLQHYFFLATQFLFSHHK